MKVLYTLTFLFFLSYSAMAQIRTISGRLTASDGEPLPGVNVVVKGTQKGTVTNANGEYSIDVSVGQVLVFSFIGMQTREILVTETNLQPAPSRTPRKSERRKNDPRPIAFNFSNDSAMQNSRGVATLTDQTGSYHARNIPDAHTIRAIRKRGDRYIIKTDTEPNTRRGLAVQFSTLFGIENITQLPALQSSYAQGQSNGRSLQWAGPETREIFSWGPLVRTLEYDGGSYPFDKNGRLVPAGSGNGVQAHRYDPSAFFRTGFVNGNEIAVSIPTPKQGKFIFDLENKIRTGVIPNSDYKRLNVGGTLDNFHITSDLLMDASLHYSQSGGNLLTRGGNLASIIGSIYRTPTTFDNTNGLSPKSALNNSASYKLPDGSLRSHAPGLVDNPYGLVNDLPDHEETQRVMGFLNFDHTGSSPLSMVVKSSFDHQWNDRTFGIPAGYAGATEGRLTERNDRQTILHAIATPSYRSYDYGNEFNISLSYEVDHQIRELNRTDGFDFTASEFFGNIRDAKLVGSLDRTLTRTTHDILFSAKYQLDDMLTVRFTNRNYFSNTAPARGYTNMFPSFGIKLKTFADILGGVEMSFNASVSRSLHEAPLLYSSWAHESTVLSLDDYSSHYESGEIFFNDQLIPEIARKFETGAALDWNRLRINGNYFNNKTKNFIVPVATSTGFELQNTAEIKNYGGAISATYEGWMTNGSWETGITWGKWRTVVTELYGSNEFIPLAGFESVRTVLVKGKPLGAIYGTSHVRNANGEMVIDQNGYPLEDPQLRMIGNPTPDWNMGWKSSFHWKWFSFLMLFDFTKGGQQWNGTNSMLDYLGRSATSGNDRRTSNYVFDGVTEDGSTNTVAVNFYDPSGPVTDNRWVRYGTDGIAEDYIEDASAVRLSQLAISYVLQPKIKHKKFESVKFTLSGTNLFISSRYHGVDPASSLFGTLLGNGLDLFNMPSVRSYTLQVTLKL